MGRVLRQSQYILPLESDWSCGHSIVLLLNGRVVSRHEGSGFWTQWSDTRIDSHTIEKWLELLKYRFTYNVSILIVNIDIPLARFWSWWAVSGDLSKMTWSQNRYFGPKWDESIAGVSAVFIFIYYWNLIIFRKNNNRPIIPMGNILPLDFDWSCCILNFSMLNSCPLESDWSCWCLGSSPGIVIMCIYE